MIIDDDLKYRVKMLIWTTVLILGVGGAIYMIHWLATTLFQGNYSIAIMITIVNTIITVVMGMFVLLFVGLLHMSQLFLDKHLLLNWREYFYTIMKMRMHHIHLSYITWCDRNEEVDIWKKNNCWKWELYNFDNEYFFLSRKKALMFKLIFG
jgi:hypothetical protein